MRFANTVELKNRTNEILGEVMKGRPVIITSRDRSTASLPPLREGDIEDFVSENSHKVRRMLAEAEKDIQGGDSYLFMNIWRTSMNEQVSSDLNGQGEQ